MAKVCFIFRHLLAVIVSKRIDFIIVNCTIPLFIARTHIHIHTTHSHMQSGETRLPFQNWNNGSFGAVALYNIYFSFKSFFKFFCGSQPWATPYLQSPTRQLSPSQLLLRIHYLRIGLASNANDAGADMIARETWITRNYAAESMSVEQCTDGMRDGRWTI